MNDDSEDEGMETQARSCIMQLTDLTNSLLKALGEEGKDDDEQKALIAEGKLLNII